MPVLVFDLMDTIVVDPYFRVVAPFLGTTLATLQTEKHPTAWIEFETGNIDETRFLKSFYTPASNKYLPDPAAFRQVFFDHYAFIEGMEALLTELRAQGHQLWVLSNYPHWFEVIQAKLALDRFFEGYVLSYRCGYRKPDPRIYQFLAQKVADPNQQLVLIDDRAINVNAAQEQGWQGIIFTGVADLRQKLSQLTLHKPT